MNSITLSHLQSLKQKGEKIASLTVYDATFSHLLSETGIELFLVGDSMGTAIAGYRDTLPVTMHDIAYHTRCVSRANPQAVLMADMPFASYVNTDKALENAAHLMQAGAHIVKLEGGIWLTETIQRLAEHGIPTCAHLGLTPQSVHVLGGYKVQGRTQEKAIQMKEAALQLEKAGAKLLVLECVPYALAKEITESLSIPTIGIGAGPYCDGQILVLYDMLGLTGGKPLTFVKDFLTGQTGGVQSAIKAYIHDVKASKFPALEQSFT
jgi:3-methyl-2-oxobutanoate hydroxymethyltransferase